MNREQIKNHYENGQAAGFSYMLIGCFEAGQPMQVAFSNESDFEEKFNSFRVVESYGFQPTKEFFNSFPKETTVKQVYDAWKMNQVNSERSFITPEWFQHHFRNPKFKRLNWMV